MGNCNCEPNTYHLNLGCCVPIVANANAYFTKSEINEMLEEIVISGGVTSGEVQSMIDASIPENVSAFVNDVPYLTEHQSLSGYATEQWVQNQHYITGVDLSDYATKEYVSGYTYDKETIDEKVAGGGTFDPTQYYTTGQTDNLLSLKLDASAYTPCDLSNYYNKTEVENIVNSAKTEVEGEIPSLSGYATEQWVQNQHYITGVDLSDYALKSEIPTVPTSNSAFTNDMQFITYTDLIGYINSLQSQITALNIALNECCGGSGDTGDTSDGKLFVRYANNTSKTLECGIENNVSFESYKPYYNLVKENVLEQGDITNITYAKVGDCVTVIRHSVFSGCTSLSKIDLPFDSLNNNPQLSASSIDATAFANTAIQSIGLQGDDSTSVQLPSGYTQVASELCSGCTALTTVELGDIERIQLHAFKGCTNLQSITIHNSSIVPVIYNSYLQTDALNDVGNNTFVIYVPSELVNTYKAAQGWSNYADRIFPIQ